MKFKPKLPTIYEDDEFYDQDGKIKVLKLRDNCLLFVANEWDFFKKHQKTKVEKLPIYVIEEIEVLEKFLK